MVECTVYVYVCDFTYGNVYMYDSVYFYVYMEVCLKSTCIFI